METQQLRYVVAVARSGNFSRAAEQCHVAQPSLSQQIQKLEDELGERLFVRLPRRAKLTAAGERFIPRAVRILEEMETAHQEAQATKELIHGRVVLGVLPTIAPYFLPRAILDFSRHFPGIEIVVHEDTTARLLELAVACELDMAIVSLPIRDDRFEVAELFREDLLLALPPGHALTKRRKISLRDLDGESFILMKEGHCLGDQVLNFCRMRDFHPQVSCRSTQIETIQALVKAGMGISLIPKMAARSRSFAAPTYLAMQKPKPQRTIAAVWLRQRSLGPAAGELLRRMRGPTKKVHSHR
jgi:LysR family transcriptional regulator, hydrogen peroxide-inducible genes activator